MLPCSELLPPLFTRGGASGTADACSASTVVAADKSLHLPCKRQRRIASRIRANRSICSRAESLSAVGARDSSEPHERLFVPAAPNDACSPAGASNDGKGRRSFAPPTQDKACGDPGKRAACDAADGAAQTAACSRGGVFQNSPPSSSAGAAAAGAASAVSAGAASAASAGAAAAASAPILPAWCPWAAADPTEAGLGGHLLRSTEQTE
mmetsp:Transcript_50801/g.163104  ORF Transcript_50801/g.163104 Transcript_50801/m.163104 type:complete len:209 (-) Transcript_50801:660-1286(-)